MLARRDQRGSAAAAAPPAQGRAEDRSPRPRATALKIAFPPDGARIDLGLEGRRARRKLSLKALGGALPLTWFVNGAPIGEADSRRQSAWKPDGAGFARVSVMDARGATRFGGGEVGVN